jgi:Zn-dependent protease
MSDDTAPGSFRIFRLAGINVFLHWSWFLVALFEIRSRREAYTSLQWNVLEYVALFVLVTLHEFGHALACRSVGGRADRIVLWPLGGIAFVDPPQRPGATLWSIAAGPLVNVVLAPLLIGALLFGGAFGLTEALPNVYGLVRAVAVINVGLLIFNLLPIYPLDGGQILRSLLWYPFGRARSLVIATILGFVGVGLLVLSAIAKTSVWMGVLALFVLMSCWQGLRAGLAMLKLSRLPRRAGFACPSCRAAPPAGPIWVCGRCQTPFDTFASGAVCPNCGTIFSATRCAECGAEHPFEAWSPAPPPPPAASVPPPLPGPPAG